MLSSIISRNVKKFETKFLCRDKKNFAHFLIIVFSTKKSVFNIKWNNLATLAKTNIKYSIFEKKENNMITNQLNTSPLILKINLLVFNNLAS